MTALRVNPAETRQHRYAVVIGINRYQDPGIPDLVYARADAEAVHRVLTDPQFGRIPEENIILLLDEAATQREIRKAVGITLKQQVGEEDVVYIYYAGHGSPEIDPNSNSSDGLEKYLVPYDGEADALFSSAISMEEIKKFFQRLVAKQVVFFLDSCYSGEAGGRTFQNPAYQGRHVMSAEFLEEIGGEGRLVITACHVNEVSLELNNLQHGLFTYHLIEGMRGKADRDQDGLVSIDELYQYLYHNVSREARRLGGSMRPMRKGTAVGDIYITKYQTEAQKAAEKLRPLAREETRRGNLESAAQSWRDILKLLPDDEEAQKFLTDIEKKQREAQEKKQRILEQRQGVLLNYYRSGELSAEAFGKAMELLSREKESLSETEQTIHKLLADLADGKIPLVVYRNSIELLDKGLAVRSEEELRRKTAEEEAKKRKAEEDRIRKTEEEQKRKAAEEQKRRAEEEQKQKALEEQKRKTEEEQKQKAEEQQKRKAVTVETPRLAPALKKYWKWALAAAATLLLIWIIYSITPTSEEQQPVSQPSSEAQRTTPPISTDVSSKVFRDTPRTNFTESDQNTMLKKYDFYEKYDYPSGKGFTNDYEKQKNGQVVYDRASGLMWQQSGSPNRMVHENAQKYIDQLNRDGFAGYNDWRLPTLEEAMSLMEPTKKNEDLYIDPIFDKTQRWIWTSDRYSASRAWHVLFFDGSCDINHVVNQHLRPCRSFRTIISII